MCIAWPVTTVMKCGRRVTVTVSGYSPVCSLAFKCRFTAARVCQQESSCILLLLTYSKASLLLRYRLPTASILVGPVCSRRYVPMLKTFRVEVTSDSLARVFSALWTGYAKSWQQV